MILVADSVGARVPRCARAHVHSVFPRACNFETDSGELVTLLAPDSGNLPHGIRCASLNDPLDARLRRGQAATLDATALRIPAADLVADFSRAAVWKGTVAAAPPGVETERAVCDLYDTLRSHAPDQGLAPVLFSSGNAHSAFQRALAARIAQTLPKLAGSTETGDAGAVVSALSALVGLGAGLTPAGDDFIAGYLAALWSRSYHQRQLAELLRALSLPVGQLTLRANAISRQILLDALEGHFAQCLTEVVRGLGGVGEITGAASRLLGVGHSSGADALCGLLFGFAPSLFAGRIASVAGDPAPAHATAVAC
jgi:hypothetical protein